MSGSRSLKPIVFSFPLQIDSEHELSISSIDRPMTFDLICKIIAILDAKNDSSTDNNTSSESEKVLRVSDGTKSQLNFLSLTGAIPYCLLLKLWPGPDVKQIS